MRLADTLVIQNQNMLTMGESRDMSRIYIALQGLSFSYQKAQLFIYIMSFCMMLSL